MSKTVKITAGLVALLLLAGLLYFANGLLGNPVSAFLTNYNAKKYLTEAYPGQALQLEKATYSFKTGGYYVRVASPNSPDTHFSLSYTAFGKLSHDDYADAVANGWNTYNRLNDVYWARVKQIFEAADFPYPVDIGYGLLEERYPDEIAKPFGPDYGLDRASLVLDKEYDIDQLARAVGHLTVYVQDPVVTTSRAAEILLDLKRLLDDAGLPFYAIDFTLESPRGEDGMIVSDAKSLGVQEFLYADIYPEGMEQRFDTAAAALSEHYAEQDKEKLAEVEKAGLS